MDKKLLKFSGQKLATAREGAKLTQTDIADLVGKKKQHISNYERNVAKPPADELLTIMNRLDLKPMDLAT